MAGLRVVMSEKVQAVCNHGPEHHAWSDARDPSLAGTASDRLDRRDGQFTGRRHDEKPVAEESRRQDDGPRAIEDAPHLP